MLTLPPLFPFLDLDIACLVLIILWDLLTALVARLQQCPKFQTYNPLIPYAANSISPILSLEPLLHTFEPSCFKPILSPKLQVFYRKPQVVPSVINVPSLSYFKPQDSYLEASQGLFSSSFFCSQTRAISSGSRVSNPFPSEHTATDGSTSGFLMNVSPVSLDLGDKSIPRTFQREEHSTVK